MSCKLCLVRARAGPTPKISLPSAPEFNKLGVDLKIVGNIEPKAEGMILHMMNALLTYYQAMYLNSKRSEDVVNGLMTRCVTYLSSSDTFIHNNGGEFVGENV